MRVIAVASFCLNTKKWPVLDHGKLIFRHEFTCDLLQKASTCNTTCQVLLEEIEHQSSTQTILGACGDSESFATDVLKSTPWLET